MNEAKEPWLGVILSRLWPGVGNFYGGQKVFGIAVALIQAALLILGSYLMIAPLGNVAVAFGALLLFVIMQFASCIQTFFALRKMNSESFEAERRARKDPWLAVFWALLLPGLGHFYLKRWARGIFVILIWFAIIAMLESIQLIPAEYPDPFQFLIIAMVARDAFHCADPKRTAANPHATWIILAFSIVAVAEIGGLKFIRKQIVEPYTISGRSMLPALEPTDRILVSKHIAQGIKRGDLITFWNFEAQSMYVKRVAAIGGEKVEIKTDGRVYVNGTVLTGVPYDGVNYLLSTHKASEELFWLVPPGQVFVLGDNPERSSDSRQSGPISAKDVRGIAYKIWWPLERSGLIH